MFLAATFAITCGLLGLYIVFPDATARHFGELNGTHPVFFIATWAPALAALIVVCWHRGMMFSLQGAVTEVLPDAAWTSGSAGRAR